MARFQQKAEKLAAANPRIFNKKHPILYSYDSDQVHKSAKAKLESRLGIGESCGNRLPLPFYSPDMHKVIEHTHALVARGMAEALRKDRKADKGMEYYKKLCQDVFFEKVTQEGVSKDVHSLRLLYRYIKRRQGAYAPAHLC